MAIGEKSSWSHFLALYFTIQNDSVQRYSFPSLKLMTFIMFEAAESHSCFLFVSLLLQFRNRS